MNGDGYSSSVTRDLCVVAEPGARRGSGREFDQLEQPRRLEGLRREKAATSTKKSGVVNCELGMSKPFDVALGRLTGEDSYSSAPSLFIDGGQERGTFFLETFGCQMNDHDSEK